MKVVVFVVVFFLIWRWTCASPLPCEKCGTHTECKHSHGLTKFKRDLQVILKKENEVSNSDYNTTNSTTLFKGKVIFRTGILLDPKKNNSKQSVDKDLNITVQNKIKDFNITVQNETKQDNDTLDRIIREYVRDFIIKSKKSTNILPINTQNSFIEKEELLEPVSKNKRNGSYIEQWNDALLKKREVNFFNSTGKTKNGTVAKRDAIDNKNNTKFASQILTVAKKEEVLKKNNTDEIKNNLGKRQNNITENYSFTLIQNKTVVKREQSKGNTQEIAKNITENSELGPKRETDESRKEVADSNLPDTTGKNKKVPCVNHHYYVANITTVKRDTNAMQPFDPKTMAREPQHADVIGTAKSTKEEQAIKEEAHINRTNNNGTEQEKNKSVGQGIAPKVMKMAVEPKNNTEDTSEVVEQFEKPNNITNFIGQLNFNVSVNRILEHKKGCIAQIFVTLVEPNATSNITTEFDISPIEESQNSLRIENDTKDKREDLKENSTIHTAEKETTKFRIKREITHHRSPRSEKDEKYNTLHAESRHIEVPMNITIHIQKREDDQVASEKLKRSDHAYSSVAGYANSTSKTENKKVNMRSVSDRPNATKDHHHSKRDLLETRVVRKATKRPKTNEAKTSQSSKGTNLEKTKNKDPLAQKIEHKGNTKPNPPSDNKREYAVRVVSRGIRDKRSADCKRKTKQNRNNSEDSKRVTRTYTSPIKPDISNFTTETNTTTTSENHTVKTGVNDTRLKLNKENATSNFDGLVNKTFTVDFIVTPIERLIRSNSETIKNASTLNQATKSNTTVERKRRFALWDESQGVQTHSSDSRVANHTDETTEGFPVDVILLEERDVNSDSIGVNTDEYLDGYFKYAAGDIAENEMIQLNVNELDITEKLPTMMERVKCTCAMYRSDPINKDKNPIFAETVLNAPLGTTAAGKDVLCTKSCGELAKAHLKVKQDVHCAHVKPDHKNFKEISSYVQHAPYDHDPELICCQVFTGEDEPTLQFVLSWLNIILLDVVVCLTGLGIVCMYLICFVSWRKREVLPTYAAATFAVK